MTEQKGVELNPDPLRRTLGVSPSDVAKQAVYHIVITVGAALFFLPLYYMFVTAIKPPDEVYAYPFRWLPSRPRFENFVEGWTSFPFTRYLFNTLYITALAMLGASVSISMTAFALSRLNFPAKSIFFSLIIASLLLPRDVRFVPEYIIWSKLGFVNTYVPLIAPSFLARGAAKIFLLRQFFRSLPKDMEDAARIDGATPVQRFVRIVVPNSMAGIGIVMLLEFVVNWNKFIAPLIYLKDQRLYTLNIGLNMFKTGHEAGIYGITDIHLFMAIATIIVLPTLAVFFFFQRYFVEGVQLSGTKG